jgi:hypothetical protein
MTPLPGVGPVAFIVAARRHCVNLRNQTVSLINLLVDTNRPNLADLLRQRGYSIVGSRRRFITLVSSNRGCKISTRYQLVAAAPQDLVVAVQPWLTRAAPG